MIRLYALMCVLGTVLPYSALATWSIEHRGLDAAAMLSEIAASHMSLLAWRMSWSRRSR